MDVGVKQIGIPTVKEPVTSVAERVSNEPLHKGIITSASGCILIVEVNCRPY
jgi:hypothetical protein